MSALAKLHIAKKALGLDEESYRSVLVHATGKASARAMSEAERREAVRAFEALGFKPAPARGAGSPAKRRAGHVRLVYALWGELQALGQVTKGPRGMRALKAFVKRQCGIDHPDFIDIQAAPSVIEALKSWIERANAQQAARARQETTP